MTRYSILTTLFFFSLCCSIVSLSHSLNNGFSVELIHRDSSKSPLYNSTETKFQRLTNAIHRSINYANYVNKVLPTKQTPKTTLISDKGEYLMEYSIGTPPFKVYGIFDTGSGIVWLQCKPCEDCYNQTSPIFDPSKSSTYKNLACNSNMCGSVGDTQCSNDSNCGYNIQYGDGSLSQGDLSVDTLTLDPTNGPRVAFPNTVLGCGHKNTGTFQDQSSGIIGLGGGPISFTTQLGSSIGGKFSYCLVPLLSDTNVTSSLNFGDAALVSGTGVVSTPLVHTSNGFYSLTLEGFSVGKERIEFGSNGGFSRGNIIIDSGTTLTLLPADLYSRLEALVAKVVKLERVPDPSDQLNLCYRISSQEDIHVPVITTHFSGADVVLNSLNTFVLVKEGIVCFAFASAPPELGAIFGNVAQQNLLVGYDLQKKTVSFKPTDCTKQN